jgi:hypothetical protein
MKQVCAFSSSVHACPVSLAHAKFRLASRTPCVRVLPAPKGEGARPVRGSG